MQGILAALRQDQDEADVDDLTSQLRRYATADEVDTARGNDHAAEPVGTRLAQLVTERLSETVRGTQRAALAAAPDLTASPLSTAWALPPAPFAGEGEPLAQVIARELLQGWMQVKDMRDPLIAWAVGAGLSKTAVQQHSRVARSTINTLLPWTPCPAQTVAA